MDDILKNTFGNEAIKYDETTRYLLMDYDFMLEQVVHNVGFSKEEYFNILDLGCGTGTLIKKIRAYYPNATIYALDFAKEMIEVAQNKNIKDIHYIIANMFELDNLNLPCFDVIISSFVFHNFHSINEHEEIFTLAHKRLAVNGKFIIADIIDVDDVFQKKKNQKQLISLMREHGLANDIIAKWLGILQVEDSPLPISTEIKLLRDNGFEMIYTNTYSSNNNAVFVAIKKLDLIQLKAELLFSGVKLSDFVKDIYTFQNPQDIWKTGNNGIFISINDLVVLVSINHKTNHNSPYEISRDDDKIILTKYGRKLYVDVKQLEFPNWFFSKIPELENRPFSNYFVYEGTGFLHLAYKNCSFSSKEKCLFCSTKRRKVKDESNLREICTALSSVINQIPNEVQICLGGGTYMPLEENVEYFSTIIRCIRKYNTEIPIWVEMIPPKLEAIERLINDGATSFGFNIEIWDDEIRKKICPGKSKISKEYYIEACKFALKKLGSNRVGCCLIVGLDSYESIKEAVDILVKEGIEPCLLPYKIYNRTNLDGFEIPLSYKYDFYRLSKYVSEIAHKNGIIFNENQGCLKCSCCTIMHDLQNVLF